MSQGEQKGDEDSVYVDVASDVDCPAIDAAISLEMERMREYQLEMIDVAQANANSAFDFARDLALAKTPSQLMDLCSNHAQKQIAEAAPEQFETTEFEPEAAMPKAYIKARPSGREFDPIADFAVEDDAGHVLATFDTQMEAVVWAKDAGREALVTRIRDLCEKNNPDHWRSF
jgi:hypothetical protein